MNKGDRIELARAVVLIQEGSQILADLADSEREKFENLPEGIQESERGQLFEEAAEQLEAAQDEIDSAVSDLDDLEQH